jgi:RNA polymerase sigma factor for flagellar operon FliA
MTGSTQTKHHISSDQTLELWKEYMRSSDPRLRDRLVLTLAPMVKYIVYKKVRHLPAQWSVDDFISCGLEALIRSIDRYDPKRGTTLEQFAWTRIHGAVLDELRRNDWAPRSLRRWERDINRARQQFTGLYGRTPTNDELADAVGIPVDELIGREEEIARSEVGSLHSLVQGDDDTTIERIDALPSNDSDTDPEFCAMRESAKDRFRAAFARLPERDRKVAVMLYVHNLTLREIGDVLGITESRVSQIHTALKARLRTELKAAEGLFLAVA